MIQKCIASDRFPPTRENPGRVSALRKTRTKAKIPKSVSPPRNPQRSPSAAAVNERRFGLSGVPQHSLLMYYHYLFSYCSDSPAPFEDAVMSLLSSSCLAHTGLVPRCVIIQKDENGFGLTVSGDNPVFVQLVKKGETQKKKNPVEEQREAALLYDAKGDAILHVVHCQLGCKGKGSNTLEPPLKNAATVTFSFRFYTCSFTISSLYFCS